MDLARLLALGLLFATSVAHAEPKRRKPAPPKPAYLALSPVAGPPALLGAGAEQLSVALRKWSPLTIAPKAQAEKDARAELARLKALGLELGLRLRLTDAGALSAALVISSYPEHVLRTEYRAEATGGPPEVLLGPVIDQVVGELAKDQGWQPVR